MAAKDAAFMWETEALRSGVSPSRKSWSSDPNDGWLTLRATVAATGIPISTLRKWVRKNAIPSFIHETEEGPIRMIWLEGVQERAEELGRDLPPFPDVDSENGQTGVDIEIDLDDEEVEPAPDPEPPSTEEAVTAPDPAPNHEPAPGTMVVPIEAWDKMLMQLGNLHEAGQQLADARERAGKAETEVKFLRERLAEFRAEKQEATSTPAPAVEPTPTAKPQSTRRVSIEVEDGSEEPSAEVYDVELDEEVVEDVEDESTARVTNLSNYSIAVFKHLYGTWRDRPRR